MRLSVVVETHTVTREYPGVAVFEGPLGRVLAALERQTYPRDQSEVIVVVNGDEEVQFETLKAQHPSFRFVAVENGNYFSMKNHGVAVAHGEVVALVDGDCIPAADWLERIAATLATGADLAAGSTWYSEDTPLAKTFSVFDFGHVQGDRNGHATHLNLNNVAAKRRLLLENGLREDVGRNGGCYLLSRTLRRQNRRLVYDASQLVVHCNDIPGLGFVSKHFHRGYDAIGFFRIDADGLLSETRFLQLGLLAPIAITAGRILYDLRRILVDRRDLRIPLYAVPWYYGFSVLLRGIELTGEYAALWRPAAPSRAPGQRSALGTGEG